MTPETRMRIIDARSGKEVTVGETVAYGDGSSITLLEVHDGLVHASAKLKSIDVDPAGIKIETVAQVPLRLRWMHPSFLFQRVAFIPT